MPEAARAPRARGARDLDILIVVVCKVYVVLLVKWKLSSVVAFDGMGAVSCVKSD